jgi:hypothetical protein
MNQASIDQANFTIAKEVAETLDKHYSGHAWMVTAEVEQGIVKVWNGKLSGTWGFIVNMADLANDPKMKIVIKAGGEILERYNLSRGKAIEQEIDGLFYDFKGDAVQA